MQETAPAATSKNWNLRFSLKKVEDGIVITQAILPVGIGKLVYFLNPKNKSNKILSLLNKLMFLASSVPNSGEETTNVGTYIFIGTIVAIGAYSVYKAQTCPNIECHIQESYSYKDLLIGEKPYGVSDIAWAKAQKSAQSIQYLGHEEFSTFGTPWDDRSVSQIINIIDRSDNVVISESKVEEFKLMVESAQPMFYYYRLKANTSSEYVVGKLKIEQFNQDKIDFFNSLLYEGFSYVDSSTYEKIIWDHLYSCSCTLWPKTAAITICWYFFSNLWLKDKKVF